MKREVMIYMGVKKSSISKNEISSVCAVRHALGLGCRICKFYGESCEHIKNKYNVKEPKDLYYLNRRAK